MANILDYLSWRGDLTLAQSPFNEVDNLILAELSFVNFTGIVPGPGEGEGVPLHTAAEAFFRSHEGGDMGMGVLVPDEIPALLRRMAECPRFREMRVNCFQDHLDVRKAEQFAAVTVELGDGSLYLSFRGTDDTIAGWKEDFLLGCQPEVPAQKKAVAYVKAVAGQYPRRKLMLGGPLQGRKSRRLRWHLRAPCHPAADQRRLEQRRARLLRRGAGDPPARPAGGAHPQHRAEILRGGDALGARGELHRGGQRPDGALAARRLFLAGAGDGLCDAAGSFPPGAAERPRVEGMGPAAARWTSGRSLWTAFSRC